MLHYIQFSLSCVIHCLALLYSRLLYSFVAVESNWFCCPFSVSLIIISALFLDSPQCYNQCYLTLYAACCQACVSINVFLPFSTSSAGPSVAVTLEWLLRCRNCLATVSDRAAVLTKHSDVTSLTMSIATS